MSGKRFPTPTIKQTSTGTWAVVHGTRILAEFETNAEAWRCLDKHERRALCVRRETADRYDAYYYSLPAPETGDE